MNTDLTEEALHFQDAIRKALAARGGVDLARRAHADPGVRKEVAEVLGHLGVWDLDPMVGDAELEAAAIACRVAGSVALPYPVAERLAAGEVGRALAVVDPASATFRVNMADVPLRWSVEDGQGRRAEVRSVLRRLDSKLGPFVCDVEIGPWSPDESDGDRCEAALLLQCWTLLGLVESAATDTYRYVRERQQFGTALGDFQSVQFRLTDVEVALQALGELAKYTLWSVATRRQGVSADVTALRMAALETADLVFRSCHQLHGAIGFCDETDLSWLSRASQTLRRLPWSAARTEERLLGLFEHRPLDGLFCQIETEVAT